MLEPRLVCSTIMVSTLADSGAGSLRAAIQQANMDSTPDLIEIPAGLGGVIDLTTVGDTTYGPSAFLIKHSITIMADAAGSGVSISRDSGAAAMRVFAVAPGGSLTLENITVSGGIAQGGAGGSGGRRGGGGAAGLGGAIFNAGTLTISNSTFFNNQAIGGAGGSNGSGNFTNGGGGGGGLNSSGQPGSTSGPGGAGGGPNGGTVGSAAAGGGDGGFGGGGGGGPAESINSDTQTAGNGGFGGGGGARGFGSGAGGTGGFGGGGGYGDSATGIGGFGGGNQDNNSFGGGGGAGMGGAIFNDGGTVSLSNSTFTANTARGGAGGAGAQAGQGLGGAIFNYNGSLSSLNSTISLNSADNASGIYNLADNSTSTSSITNTIIAQTDESVSDYVQSVINSGNVSSSGGGDLIGSTTSFGGTIVSSADPQLGSLANNGGPTETLLPANSSPAVDGGISSAAAGLSTDQRGLPRIVGAAVDIGAVETGAIAPNFTSGNTAMYSVGTLGTFTFTTSGAPTPTVGEQGVIPGGLTFTPNGDGTATLSGTPGVAGIYHLTLSAANGSAHAATQNFTLTVDQAALITSSSSATFSSDTPASFTITTTGFPTAQIQENGTLPAGISFIDNGNGTATLSGTSTAAPGVYPLTIAASNSLSLGSSTLQSFTLNIVAAPPIVVGQVGVNALITAYNPDGSARFTILPFPNMAQVSPRVALADLNNDGIPDIVAAAGPGGKPRVKIFDGTTGALLGSFLAFNSTYAGGLFVAAGNVSGSSTPDIIVSKGEGSPRVRIFNGATDDLEASFLAYPATFRGGVRVAAADLNGDGNADVIVAPGPGTPEQLVVFSGSALMNGLTTELAHFFPHGASFNKGLFVAAGDINGDGTPDIITGEDAGGTSLVRVFSGQSGNALLQSFTAFGTSFTGGVRVAVAEFNGEADILAAAGQGSNAVDLFSGADDALFATFDTRKAAAAGGLFVA
jgi:hypothetical protein